MRSILIIFILFLPFCNYKKNQILQQVCFSTIAIDSIPLTDFKDIKAFEKKIVKLEGYYHNNFEDVGLYKHRLGSPFESVWVEVCDSLLKYDSVVQLMNYKKIVLLGVVDTNRKGHFGEYIATIDSVFCMKEQ